MKYVCQVCGYVHEGDKPRKDVRFVMRPPKNSPPKLPVKAGLQNMW